MRKIKSFQDLGKVLTKKEETPKEKDEHEVSYKLLYDMALEGHTFASISKILNISALICGTRFSVYCCINDLPNNICHETTDYIVRKVIEYFKSGMEIPIISDKLEVGVSRINQVILEYRKYTKDGIEMIGKRNLRKHKVEEMVKYCEEGMTNVDIAKIFGCNTATVRTILIDYYKTTGKARPIKKYKKTSGIDVDLAVKMRSTGSTYKEIGKFFGCSEMTIRNNIRESGMYTPQRYIAQSQDEIIGKFSAFKNGMFLGTGISIIEISRLFNKNFKQTKAIYDAGESGINGLVIVKDEIETPIAKEESMHSNILKDPKIVKVYPIEELIRLYEGGKNFTEIGNIIGTDNSSVGKRIRKYYSDLGKDFTSITEVRYTIEELIRLYESGLNFTEISNTLDYDRSQIGKRINAYYKSKGIDINVMRNVPKMPESDERQRKHQMIHTNPNIHYASEGLFKVTPKAEPYTRNVNKFVTNDQCIIGIKDKMVIIYNGIENMIDDINPTGMEMYTFGTSGSFEKDGFVYKLFKVL